MGNLVRFVHGISKNHVFESQIVEIDVFVCGAFK